MIENQLQETMIVFDIGGTWFRSGVVLPNGALVDDMREPSISFKNHPDKTVDELQSGLTDYIIRRVEALLQKHADKNIHIASLSLGAPVNANTELMLGSGPLWGPKNKSLNLKGELQKRLPAIKFLLVNDISAALMYYAKLLDLHEGRVSLMTISTGTGSRTLDLDRKQISVDEKFGIQGETGHIKIPFFIQDRRIHAACDCGAEDHLNAFCSGRGIERILPIFADIFKDEFKQSGLFSKFEKQTSSMDFSSLIESVKNKEEFGRLVLKYVTWPIANMIIHQFTFDPLVKKFILMGGVLHSLNPAYYKALLVNLDEIGLYHVSENDSGFFKEHVIVGEETDNAGMIGAALWGEMKINKHF